MKIILTRRIIVKQGFSSRAKISGSGYMLTDESGKSKLLACQTEERQNDPECHHA